ncbi:hypothetical protein [Pseudovibrio brasiliensis]|uniref:hypothetical protein n=1 Tax=Pseudovibrio brasiliensis TaxID=1898042 RepID=UPI000B21EE57|nr:hypothetical protein [Pseudovibrio brasiliensis]
MDAEVVEQMMNLLNPKSVLPIHHSTFGLFLEPIWKLVQAMDGHASDLDLIAEGSHVLYK